MTAVRIDGNSSINAWNSRWPMTSSLTIPSARTVAVRGTLSTSAISPKKSPGPSSRTGVFPRRTITRPSRTMKNS